jgi:hypothetical protein
VPKHRVIASAPETADSACRSRRHTGAFADPNLPGEIRDDRNGHANVHRTGTLSPFACDQFERIPPGTGRVANVAGLSSRSHIPWLPKKCVIDP